MPGTHEHGCVRGWTPRYGALLGVACVFLAPMATVAIASTGDSPASAIPQTSLDRLLGRAGRHGSVATVTAHGHRKLVIRQAKAA